MNKLILILCVQIVGLMASAATDKKTLEAVTNQSIELYNNQQYSESLAELDKIKSSRDAYLIWYYYYGLNQMGLGQDELALQNLSYYIKKPM